MKSGMFSIGELLVAHLLISPRLMNWEERYFDRRNFRHLQATITFLNFNWVTTGNHLSSFKTGVMWSYLLVLVAIRAVRCILLQLLMTYSPTLNYLWRIRPYVGTIKKFTKDYSIIVIRVRLSNKCVVRLIWLRQGIQEETVLITCSS